jgi:NADPH:quinone reductase-like Zn-dependent oxidoreductase
LIQFHELSGLLAARQIQPVIAARMPLREAARANELFEKAQVSGNIVLLCQE